MRFYSIQKSLYGFKPKKRKKNAMVGFVYLKYPFVDMLKWDLREMKLKERSKNYRNSPKKR